MNTNDDTSSNGSALNEEVKRLRERAKALRDSLPDEDTVSKKTRTKIQTDPPSQVTEDTVPSKDYRLYLDIGREPGTWMEPRWGASGKRIECTIDVSFRESGADYDTDLAGPDIIANMVNDNKFGKTSTVRILDCSSPTARLRGGFDSMNVSGGGYRIDAKGDKGKSYTSSALRFYLEVDGTAAGDTSSTYGDISIPQGRLYFSLPCFGTGVGQLSTKEGIVTVREVGWHTGWRRMESRIVGVFRAKQMEEAKKRDKF